MDNSIPGKLKDIVARHGKTLLDDRKRCEDVLNENFPGACLETAALMAVLRQKIPQKLARASQSGVTTTLMANLGQQASDECGLRHDVARWAVDAWAAGLGLAFPADQAGIEEQTNPNLGQRAPHERPAEPLGPAPAKNTNSSSISVLLESFFQTDQFRDFKWWARLSMTLGFAIAILLSIQNTYLMVSFITSALLLVTPFYRIGAAIGLSASLFLGIDTYNHYASAAPLGSDQQQLPQLGAAGDLKPLPHMYPGEVRAIYFVLLVPVVWFFGLVALLFTSID